MALSDATNTINTEESLSAPVEKEAPADSVTAAVEEPTNEAPIEQTEDKKMDEEPENREAMLEELKSSLISGRRFMKTGEYQKASEHFSRSTELAVLLHGDFSEKAFEPHLQYGRALVEIGRMEDQVIDNAIATMPKAKELEEDSIDEEKYENPDALTETEREDIKQKVEQALAEVSAETEAEEKPEAEESSDAKEVSEVAKEDEAPEVEGDDEEVMEKGEGASDEDRQEAGDAENDVEMNEEDDDENEETASEPSNLEVAWEILEIARKICDKTIDELAKEEEATEKKKTWNLHKADVLVTLGDASFLDDKFELAIKDLTEALDIQKVYLEPHSRILAETCHLVGRAYRAHDDFGNAAEFFKQSKDILVNSSEVLEKAVNDEVSDEIRKDHLSELKEIREIIPDIEAQIEDAVSSKEQADKAKAVLKDAFNMILNITGENGTSAQSDGPVNDISGMIRRGTKRRGTPEPNETKKAKEDGEEEGEVSTKTEAEAEEVKKEEAKEDLKGADDVEMPKADDSNIEPENETTTSVEEPAKTVDDVEMSKDCAEPAV